MPPIYIKNFPLKKSVPIIHVEHHLAHAASAYYTGGATNGNALICTMDGAGDNQSICLWRWINGKIEVIEKFSSSHGSIGWFYSAVTEALGWWHGDGEGKTMGLAPYGEPEKVNGVLDKFYPKFENGNLVEPKDFRPINYWNESGAYQWHMKIAYEIKKLIEKFGAENIAAKAQSVLEQQVKNIIFPWLENEKTKNLYCAGGVFLNVKLNQRIWESGKVIRQHIYPNAGDSGLAVGAALYVFHKLNNFSGTDFLIDSLNYGPEYSNEEIKQVLDDRNLKYEYYDNIEEKAAKLLSQNKIIGWFQGRMESGPRALGNRSILMSANNAENKDILNAKVKYREAFRPFCPSLLKEKKDFYLKNNRSEPFMITSFTITENKENKVPAVVHVDKTLRPQTVDKNVNNRYWNLINEFGEITGEYLLLNTSFNIAGEPIVNHPREAIRCFYDSGIDCLILGNYIIQK